MFSFVISSRGHLTDSRYDAPDSSNFCFAGRKLWLAWDTYGGGPDTDCRMWSGHPSTGAPASTCRAGFPCAARGGFLVNPGETLFLPANMTHKVITLESYIGVGGFFLGASKQPAAPVPLDRPGHRSGRNAI